MIGTPTAMTRRRRRVITLLAVALSIVLMLCGCAAEPIDSIPKLSEPITSSQAGDTASPTTVNAEVAEPNAMVASKPVRLEIPSLGIDTVIIDLALNADGTLEVPPDGTTAGWYTGAPTPGEVGPAILAGHVDWHGTDGVFFDLRRLQPGASIIVSREDGSRAVFSATAVEGFPKDAFPTATVYGDIDHPGLRLITCGGDFDENARSYTDNIIAFADLD